MLASLSWTHQVLFSSTQRRIQLKVKLNFAIKVNLKTFLHIAWAAECCNLCLPTKKAKYRTYMEGFFLASLLFMAATVVNLTMWHFYSFWYNSRLSVLLISTLCIPLTRLDVNVAMLFGGKRLGKNILMSILILYLPRLQYTAFTKTVQKFSLEENPEEINYSVNGFTGERITSYTGKLNLKVTRFRK